MAPDAAGVAVLTHRFWTTSLNSDPTVVGKTIRLGPRTATVVGVLEPSVPYPADTEIIANVVTSPHHLGRDDGHRAHAPDDGALRPAGAGRVARRGARRADRGARRDDARASRGVLGAAPTSQLSVTPLRDQIAAPARTILLVLLAAAGVVFVIACSNVANLILARSVRREGELAVRAALGASRGALRRTLLAESLVLCGAGAVLGVLLARPLVAVVARFAARFSVRALEVTVDASLLWVGAGLAMAAAVLLAYVPRLPSAHGARPDSALGRAAASGSRRAPTAACASFATTQIAFSFVLLAGAGMLLAALVALQTANTGYNMRQVLALDLPTPSLGVGDAKEIDFYQEVTRRIGELPGVEGVALGSFVPWRDAGTLGPGFQFAVEGYAPADGEENPHARLAHRRARLLRRARRAAPRRPRLHRRRSQRRRARRDREPERRAAAVPQRRRGRTGSSGGPIRSSASPQPRRIVGVVADVDDENVVRRAGAHDLSPVPADAALPAGCSCTRRAIRTRSCRR